MFFIFGSPRSGTTLLAQCLSAHTKILIPHETDFIIPLAFIFDRIREPKIGKEILVKLVTNSVAFQNSIGEYLSHEQVCKVIESCDYHPARILESLYEELASSNNKLIAGDKSPNDLFFLRILIKVGALDGVNTKIVHIVRDIRDVMVSLNKVQWNTDLDLYFPRFWSSSNLYLHSLYKDKKDKYFFVRYEDMVKNPELTFRKICDFLEVEFQVEMLDSQRFNPRYKDMPVHAKLYKPISTDNIGVYKISLTQSQLISYEKQAGEALRIFKYQLGQKTLFEKVTEKFQH